MCDCHSQYICRYNSTIFSTISANAYDIFVGSASFGQSDLSGLTLDSTDSSVVRSFIRLHERAENGTLYQLDNSACVNAYATSYQSTYDSLIVVTDDISPVSQYYTVDQQEVFNPAYEAAVGASPYRWLCADLDEHTIHGDTPCITYLSEVRTQVANNNWTVGGFKSATVSVKRFLHIASYNSVYR